MQQIPDPPPPPRRDHGGAAAAATLASGCTTPAQHPPAQHPPAQHPPAQEPAARPPGAPGGTGRSSPIAAANAWYPHVAAIGPSPDPCLCGAWRGEHSGPTARGRCQRTGCRRYRRDVAYELAVSARRAELLSYREMFHAYTRAAHPPGALDKGGWRVGPSDAGECRRRIWYREMRRIGKLDHVTWAPSEEGAARIGTMIHDAEVRLYAFSHPHRWFEREVYLPGLDRPGRMDAYDPISGEGVDFKTMGEWSWEDALRRGGPREQHWKQLSIYLLGIKLDVRGTDPHTAHNPRRMRIIAIRRENGQRREYTRPWDEAYARRALSELTAINTALDWGEELPRDRSGPSTDTICARYCEARIDCWNMTLAQALGRSPESVTHLGEHGDPDEIAFAAQELDRLAAAKRRAEDDYKRKVPWLKGISGRFGGWEVRQRRKTTRAYKAWRDQVLDLLEGAASPDVLAAKIAELPVPESVSYSPEVVRRDDDPPGGDAGGSAGGAASGEAA